MATASLFLFVWILLNSSLKSTSLLYTASVFTLNTVGDSSYDDTDKIFTVQKGSVIECAQYCLSVTECQAVYYNDSLSLCNGFGFEITKEPRRSKDYHVIGKECIEANYQYSRTVDMCFKVNRSFITWKEAIASCSYEGGQLALLDSQKKTRYMCEYIRNNGRRNCFVGAASFRRGRVRFATLDRAIELRMYRNRGMYVYDNNTRPFICEREDLQNQARYVEA